MVKKLKHTSLLLVFSGVALGLLIGLANSVKSKPKAYRLPANAVLGKHQRMFEVEVKAAGEIPKDESKEVTLTAHVTLLMPVKGEVFYKWNLPTGASIASGEAEDSLVGLEPGQLLEKQISITGISQNQENQIVSLQVWMDVNGVKMGAAGVFATKPQEVQLANSNGSNKQLLKASAVPEKELPDFIQQ
jgi:hypothetical protein